jgi:hypothetical protein
MQIDKRVAERPREGSRDCPAKSEKSELTPAAAYKSSPESSDWEGLVRGIRRGEAAAREQFLAGYSRGAKVFFKHNLGPVGLDSLVTEVMQGAVAEVYAGLIQTPADLIAFFRVILKQQQGLTPGPGEPTRANGSKAGASHLGSSDKARIRRKADLLQDCLRECNSRDREMLWRYYVEGAPLDQILMEFGADQAEFQRLKARLYESIARADSRRLPTMQKNIALSRKAATGR